MFICATFSIIKIFNMNPTNVLKIFIIPYIFNIQIENNINLYIRVLSDASVLKINTAYCLETYFFNDVLFDSGEV